MAYMKNYLLFLPYLDLSKKISVIHLKRYRNSSFIKKELSFPFYNFVHVKDLLRYREHELSYAHTSNFFIFNLSFHSHFIYQIRAIENKNDKIPQRVKRQTGDLMEEEETVTVSRRRDES